MKTHITQPQHVALLVKTFYNELLSYELMKPIFASIDVEKHMPHMIAFWEFVLLDKEGYTTNVFDKHVNLPLSEAHFQLWLSVFESTVHNLFEGEKADLAINRAQTIAFSFKAKLKHMNKLL